MSAGRYYSKSDINHNVFVSAVLTAAIVGTAVHLWHAGDVRKAHECGAMISAARSVMSKEQWAQALDDYQYSRELEDAAATASGCQPSRFRDCE